LNDIIPAVGTNEIFASDRTTSGQKLNCSSRTDEDIISGIEEERFGALKN